MSSMLFYDRPVALNRDQHRHVKLASNEGDYAFARHTNSLLLAASELTEAAKDYPIVFVGTAGGPYTLAALLGLGDNENLFLDADGKWANGTYVPAFARRYPFVLAEGQDAQTDLTVCIDESYAGLNAATGDALFDADGNESPALQQHIAFLKLFHADMQQTRLFAESLAALDLLEPKTVTIDDGGAKRVLDGFFVVNQARLRALGDAETLALVRSGAMYCIDAHQLSLSNIERLAIRQALQQAPSQAAAINVKPAPPAPPVPVRPPAKKAGQRGKRA
jgi:hypothetical protein